MQPNMRCDTHRSSVGAVARCLYSSTDTKAHVRTCDGRVINLLFKNKITDYAIEIKSSFYELKR